MILYEYNRKIFNNKIFLMKIFDQKDHRIKSWGCSCKIEEKQT